MIFIGILTYNRLELLKRLVRSVETQTYTDYCIFVMDNGSNDGTFEYFNDYPNLHIKKSTNDGAAKGWFKLIEWFKTDNRFDYLYLADDDGFLDNKQLLTLFDAINRDKNLLAVSAIQLDEIDRESLVFSFPVRPFFRRKPSNVHELNSSTSVDLTWCNFFNGCLIRREAIEKIGNVDYSYGIYGEEVDFLFRLRNMGNTKSIKEAIHYHPIVSNRPLNSYKIHKYLTNSIKIAYRYYPIWMFPLKVMYTVLKSLKFALANCRKK